MTADGDPLAELARIVSGRPPSEPTSARPGGASLDSSEPDIERDLEAELLNDLQASFAALSGPLETTDGAGSEPGMRDAETSRPELPAPLPPSPFENAEMSPPVARGGATPEPSPDSNRPDSSRPESARPESAKPESGRPESSRPESGKPESGRPEPAPRKQPDPFSFDISQAFDEAEAAAAKVVRAEQARRTEPRQPRPYAPPLRGPASALVPDPEPTPEAEPAGHSEPASRSQLPARVAAVEARAQHPVAVRHEPAAARPERPPVPPVAERPATRRPAPAPLVRGERPNIPVRPLPMDEDEHFHEPPPPRRAVTAPRPPKAEQAAPLPSRFAPQRAAAVAPPPPPPLRRPAQPQPQPSVDPVDEDFEFDLADLQADLDGPFEDEFTLDDLDMGAYDADDEFPPFPEEEVAGRRRSGRLVAVVAVMLAVVAVGGAAVFLYRGDAVSDGPPPIIAAEQGPNKVQPDPSGASAESDAQSKLIYDRVDESGEGSDTRLVTGESEIGSIPADDGADTDNPISRVIIPGGPGIDSPLAPGGDESVVADAGVPEVPGEAQSEIGPRMVRTVVVKPDGTIVSSEATGVDENGNALPGTADGDASSLLPETPRSEMDNVLDGGNLSVNADPLSQPGSQEEPASSAEAPGPLPGTAVPEVPDLPSPQPDPPPAAAAEPVPAPQPAPPPPSQETQVAARSNGPIDLTPGTAPAAGPATASGGVLVQVAAQRSEDAAMSSYRDLQRRYPSILGAFQPTIVRADLGAKGVFYRVRVGPFAGNDATRLCNDLKAAGGDCMLAR